MNARYTAETKKRTVSYELGGKTYELALTLHLIAEIQEQRGELSEALAEAATSIKKLTELYVLIFNEAIYIWNEDHPEERRELFTEETLGRRLTYFDVEALTAALFEMVGRSMPQEEAQGAEVSDEMRELLDSEELPEGKNARAGDD